MKRLLFASIFPMLLLVLSTPVIRCQTLSYSGGSIKFAKGNIDTELLLEIIQQKQEEIKQRIFRNVIIREFNESEYTKNIRNFTSQYYVYNVMNILTEGKNKKAMTQEIMEQSIQFAYVFGFYLYAKEQKNLSKIGEIYNKSLSQNEKFKRVEDTTIKNFNISLDQCLDVIINNNDKEKPFYEHFNSLKKDYYFQTWYKKDNCYLKNKDNVLTIDDTLYKSFVGKFRDFKDDLSILNDFFKVINKDNQDIDNYLITENQYKSMKRILSKFLEILKKASDKHSNTRLITFLLENTIIEYSEDKTQNLYIDIEALISQIYDSFSDLFEKFNRTWVRPFFSIGVNNGIFLNNNTLATSGSLANINFASEKIGLRFNILNRKYTRSFKYGEDFKFRGSIRKWLRPQEQPTISNYHAMIYASGLLYNIVNLKTEDNFNYALAGVGLGATFFNDLSLNISLASPLGNLFKTDNMFINIGFDIPILDYITVARKKK